MTQRWRQNAFKLQPGQPWPVWPGSTRYRPDFRPDQFWPFYGHFSDAVPPRSEAHIPAVLMKPLWASHAEFSLSSKSSKPPWKCKLASSFQWLHSRSKDVQTLWISAVSCRETCPARQNVQTHGQLLEIVASSAGGNEPTKIGVLNPRGRLTWRIFRPKLAQTVPSIYIYTSFCNLKHPL